MEKTSSHLLDEALSISNNNNNNTSVPNRSFILIEDCVETSGAFVIHHILKRCLSSPNNINNNNNTVLLVSLSHPFSHYDRILRKHGCNLSAHRDNKRFFFIDMLMLDCSAGSGSNNPESVLIGLYAKIQKVVEEVHEGSKCITIILDDFSLIEVAARGSLNRCLDFLRYCYTLTSEYDCSVAILHHEDIYYEEESSSLILQLEYLANFVIKAEPLSTGLATDVHGQLTVVDKGTHDQVGSMLSKVQNFHFKLRENGVDCFYPGSRA